MPALHHSVFTGLMLFLSPNQQRQSTVIDPCLHFKEKINVLLQYYYNRFMALLDFVREYLDKLVPD